MKFLDQNQTNFFIIFTFLNTNRFKEDDKMDMKCIDKHIISPAKSLPIYNPPTTPFRLWKHRDEPIKSYKYPLCVPVSAIALTAKKQNIDLSKYDFVGLRRSIKRILSFSPQLNTNFQMINGTIFAEDVPIHLSYHTYNYGYQLEMACTKGIADGKENKDETDDNDKEMKNNESTESSNNNKRSQYQYPFPFKPADNLTEEDKDNVIGMKLDEERKKEDEKLCIPMSKTGDYYHLVEVEIGDLKLLLCAEVDCVDNDGNAMEIKFGKGDKHVSIWSQCLLSGTRNVIQAHKTFQTLCTIVTGLSRINSENYFCSEPHQNAQLMVFYNVLKDIKARLSCNKDKGKGMDVDKSTEEKEDENEDIDLDNNKKDNDDYVASNIYRLSRQHSHENATMFEVGNINNLITRKQWKFINDYANK